VEVARAEQSKMPQTSNSQRLLGAIESAWAWRMRMVLAGHLLNSLFGIAEIRRERLLFRYQQKCQQNGRLDRIFTCVFNAP
jgi:hypothetical protein